MAGIQTTPFGYRVKVRGQAKQTRPEQIGYRKHRVGELSLMLVHR